MPLPTALRSRLAEVVRFGMVGGVAYVVDVGLFNLLRFGPGQLLGDSPLTAKVVSVAVATVASWLGNRYFTFGARRTGRRGREFVLFAIINVVGMGIAVACLAFSHYVLGLTSPLADNISANVVGLILGTVFRYLAYRTFVFTAAPSPDAASLSDGASPGAGPRPNAVPGPEPAGAEAPRSA